MLHIFGRRLNGNRKGFTLVELLVVIAIIAILIAIAVLNTGSASKYAKVNAHNANIREITSAVALFALTNPTVNIDPAVAVDGGAGDKLASYFKNGVPRPMYKNVTSSGADSANATDTFSIQLKDGIVTVTPGEVQLDGGTVKGK